MVDNGLRFTVRQRGSTQLELTNRAFSECRRFGRSHWQRLRVFWGGGSCETIRKQAPNVLALLHEVIADQKGVASWHDDLFLHCC